MSTPTQTVKEIPTPENWHRLDLSRLGFIKGRAPKRLVDGADDGYLPYLSPDYLRNVTAKVLYCTAAQAVPVAADDPIVLWDGSNAGEVFLSKNGALASTMCKVSREAHLLPKYLYYFLKLKENEIKSLVKGSGIPHVDSYIFGRLNSIFPDSEKEQELIVNGLTFIDELISLTEAEVAKLGRVRQGLIIDLLTRGIDEHGKIRSEATHKFKDSPIGRIPESWDAMSVRQLLAPIRNAMRSGPFGSALLKSELVPEGVPLLGIDNVYVEQFVDKYSRFVTPKKAHELARYRVRPDDVMITIMGTVGRCCVAPPHIGVALSSKHVWTMSFDKNRYSPLLACLQFNYAPWVLQHFRRDEQGGIMSAIRSETLKTTVLPVPPLPEAKRAEILINQLTEQLAVERNTIEKLGRRDLPPKN
jgi:type I restriction enzyme S subunit